MTRWTYEHFWERCGWYLKNSPNLEGSSCRFLKRNSSHWARRRERRRRERGEEVRKGVRGTLGPFGPFWAEFSKVSVVFFWFPIF